MIFKADYLVNLLISNFRIFYDFKYSLITNISVIIFKADLSLTIIIIEFNLLFISIFKVLI